MNRPRRGFSLVEMVISIALIGALAVMATPLLRLPITAWSQAAQRADLMQAADGVNARLALDLARALPGSVRVRQVGARVLLEVLEVRAQGRYRSGNGGAGRCPSVCGLPPAMADALAFAPACNDSCFVGLGAIESDPADAPLPNDWVVVMGDPAGDPYAGGSAIVPGGVKTRLVDAVAFPEGPRVRHTPYRFGSASPASRYYIVAGSVSWDFDPTAGTVRRHAGYPVAAVQPLAFGAAATSVVVSDGLRAATLQLQPAALPGGGTLSARLQFERAAPGAMEVERFEMASQYRLPALR